MQQLNIAQNIMDLRHKKGITQDELAAFLNVTKASVSKWETKLSYPDILLLPQIATYFDISIDELVGYEPQLSPEQIKKVYDDLAKGFSTLPFEEVMKKSREIVKQYYCCYPLVMQISILWLNHFMLAQDQKEQKDILSEIVALCDHTLANCADIVLSRDATQIKSMVNIALGKAKDVIEELEPLLQAKQQLTDQAEPILLQAYIMTGDISKAAVFSQWTIYKNVLSLVYNSIGFLGIYMDDKIKCEKTIKRVTKVIDAYSLDTLHPNITLQFCYQAAVFYCHHGMAEKALKELDVFVNGSLDFIKNGLSIHGDEYFDRLEEMFETMPLKSGAPRSEKIVLESLLPALNNPAFSLVFETGEYKKLKKRLEMKIKES